MTFFETIRDDIKTWWANGTRGLLIAFLVFIASMFIFAAVTVYSIWITQERKFDPFEFESPQIVAESVAQQGGSIHVTATKCNVTDEPVAYEYTLSWRNVITRELVFRKAANGLVREPGCKTTTFENHLTEELEPGLWRLEGVETALSETGEKAIEPYLTEEFEVVGD